jgi:hypothetical protein
MVPRRFCSRHLRPAIVALNEEEERAEVKSTLRS